MCGVEAIVSNPITSHCTILVVDDELDIRHLLSEALRQPRYRVVTAANGEQAVEVTRMARPHVILMDLNLPVMDGLAATHVIRYYLPLREVPIIAMTAYDLSGMKEAALAAGCNGYIAKPIDLDQLAELLSKILGSQHSTEQTN